MYYYYKYEKDTGNLNMPAKILPFLVNYITNHSLRYDIVQIPPNESESIDIINLENFQDREDQIDAINFLISEAPMKALQLQTGSGKTFIAVRAIMELKLRTLVVVPAYVMSQWHISLQNMCKVEVGVLQGNKSILKLIDARYETNVGVFLASINTLQEYAAGVGIYNTFPSFRSFIRDLKIGIKIVDEYHTSFSANTIIDVQSDVANNLYLSATHFRSDRNSNAIFQKIFPKEIRFDEQEYNRYVNITEYQYSFGDIHDKLVSTNRGWSEFKYEQLLLRSQAKLEKFVDSVLHPVMEEYYITKKHGNQKLLILVGLREFAEFLALWIKEHYPDYSVSSFLYGDPDELLESTDIIISTLGSCGVGRDIKGLRSVILFASFGAESLTMQTIGRLRKMEDTPEFVYLVNTGIKAHRKQAAKRRPIYNHIGKTFKIV